MSDNPIIHELRPGIHIYNAIGELLALAVRHNRTITSRFNGVCISVAPDSNPAEILRRWKIDSYGREDVDL